MRPAMMCDVGLGEFDRARGLAGEKSSSASRDLSMYGNVTGNIPPSPSSHSFAISPPTSVLSLIFSKPAVLIFSSFHADLGLLKLSNANSPLPKWPARIVGSHSPRSWRPSQQCKGMCPSPKRPKLMNSWRNSRNRYGASVFRSSLWSSLTRPAITPDRGMDNDARPITVTGRTDRGQTVRRDHIEGKGRSAWKACIAHAGFR